MSENINSASTQGKTTLREVFSPARNSYLYRAVWRWHFYAALVVIPFLIVASVSGMLMLVSKPVDSLLQRNLLEVTPGETRLPASELLSQVQQYYPDSTAVLYHPPENAAGSARFGLTTASGGEHGGHGDPGITAFQNPYTGEVLGSIDPTRTIYEQVKTLHGTLFMGNTGDSLVELAAGLTILMVLSGLYLAWPRQNGRVSSSAESSPRAVTNRESWRSQHRLTGFIVTIPLLFFLVSGLAWTNVWGGKLVQPWSSLPGTTYEAGNDSHSETQDTHADAPNTTPHAEPGTANHASLNHNGMNQVPWTLEQTPMPATESGSANLNLDDVVRIARAEGFGQLRVHLPNGHNSVWTVSATTIAGDLQNPLNERTIHIDPASGQLLADHKFQDYPAMGKAMSAFIPLHQGDLGLWNLMINLLLCALIIFMTVSGLVLWWKRRPSQKRSLQPPAASPAFVRGVIVAMLVLALAFPLSAAFLTLMIVIDWLLISRLELFRSAFK